MTTADTARERGAPSDPTPPRGAGAEANAARDPRAPEQPDAPAPATSAFDPAELAIVLSHYDVGVIDSIARFRRGSASTPKLLVTAETGRFVLKRRSGASAEAARVRFSHRLQQRLAEANFPLPPLVGTRNDRRTILELNGRVYELFRFLEGDRYDGSPAHTRLAGYALALFHELAAGIDAEPAPPSFHANAQTPYHLRDLGLPGDAHHELALRYEHAAANAAQLGVGRWPVQTIHGDWHPGNLLFNRDRLAAVIDYDTARPGQRAIDLASAALQFSLTTGGTPDTWPEAIDESRYAAFLTGYESRAAERADGSVAGLISKGELRALPHLMIESLVSEVAAPIVATGRFGSFDAPTMLGAVHRKAAWLAGNADRLASVLDDAPSE